MKYIKFLLVFLFSSYIFPQESILKEWASDYNYWVTDNPLYIDNCPVQAITIKENKYDFEIIYDIDDEYEISSSGIFSYEIIVRKNIGTQNESGTLIINSKYSKCKGINRGNNYVLNYSFTDVKYYDGSTGRGLLIDINGKVSVYSLSVCHLGC